MRIRWRRKNCRTAFACSRPTWRSSRRQSKRSWRKCKPVLQAEAKLHGLSFQQPAYSHAQESEWLSDEFFTGQKETSDAIQLARFLQRVLERDLAGQRLKIRVSKLHLDGLRQKTFPFQ